MMRAGSKTRDAIDAQIKMDSGYITFPRAAFRILEAITNNPQKRKARMNNIDNIDNGGFLIFSRSGSCSADIRTLRVGTKLEHKTMLNRDGTPLRARTNGKCKTWKTRPKDFKLPCVHGLKDYFYILREEGSYYKQNTDFYLAD